MPVTRGVGDLSVSNDEVVEPRLVSTLSQPHCRQVQPQRPMSLGRAHWDHDTTHGCRVCAAPFAQGILGAATGVHHCRRCGAVVCGNCSGQACPVAATAAADPTRVKPKRVCATCYADWIRVKRSAAAAAAPRTPFLTIQGHRGGHSRGGHDGGDGDGDALPAVLGVPVPDDDDLKPEPPPVLEGPTLRTFDARRRRARTERCGNTRFPFDTHAASPLGCWLAAYPLVLAVLLYFGWHTAGALSAVYTLIATCGYTGRSRAAVMEHLPRLGFLGLLAAAAVWFMSQGVAGAAVCLGLLGVVLYCSKQQSQRAHHSAPRRRVRAR